MDNSKIDAAIQAHEAWKARLKDAVHNGKSEHDPVMVAKDDQCAFGKWLYQEVPAEERKKPLYERVRLKHAEFHKCAAHVLMLALNGEKQRAELSLGFGGDVAKISSMLEQTLQEWKDT